MVKKIKGLLAIIVFILVLGISKNVNASEDVTKKLYQDITINNDGSITVKEVALLDGEYNGRSREIEFKNYNSNTFTGIYSNFTGNTDIYDGTSITNIKIYDISQNNFNTIDDINKVEKVYKEVESAKNGKYGVYTLSRSSYDAEFKIYCPSKKNKVFGMEYTITDAVVIHNDVAELYWNVMGDNYRENIEDFQVVVHLSGEDNDLRVWTHGPLSGINNIIDSKTIYFKDINVKKYEPETIRIMFNKNLVPNGTKKSNVNGREYILKYEQSMADSANAERNNKKLELINDASEAVIKLEKYKRIYYYNYALERVEKIEDGIEKQEFLQRIYTLKDVVNEKWKEDIEYEIQYITKYNYKYISKSKIDRLKEKIQEGFDEEAKVEFRKVIPIFNNVIKQQEATTRKVCTNIVFILYIILLIPIIYKLIKIILERNKYKGKYYREFPSEDNPYVLEYLMKKKITNLSFSATILNLIVKKAIKVQKNSNDDIEFIRIDNYMKQKTEAENIVLNTLFDTIGKDNRCSINALKTYGKTESKAHVLDKKIRQFKKSAKLEAKNRNYFKTDGLTIFFEIIVGINYLLSMIMAIGIFKGIGSAKSVITYLALVTIVSGIYYIIVKKDKNRTTNGMLEYSKWLAHKRFLKNFSNFDEKELPEIELWEKYLVTATILGCANKVESKMKLYSNNYDNSTSYLLLATSLNHDFIKTMNKSINTSINRASYTISSSSSSSGGGFGGGSSGGGGGRRPVEAAEVVSN